MSAVAAFAISRPWPRLLLALWLALAAGAGLAQPPAKALTVAVDPVLEPMVNRLARSFTTLHGMPVDVVVAPAAGQAAEQVRSGAAALALGFMQPAGKGTDRITDKNGNELVHRPLGNAALIVFVNGRNPLRQLSQAQLKAVYADARPSWSQFGGKAQTIVRAPHTGLDTSGLMFDSYVQPTALQASTIAQTNVAGDFPPWQAHAGDFPSILYVAIDQYAIGYASSVAVWRAQADGGKIQPLAIDGVEPTPQAVRSGRYPLSRPVELVHGLMLSSAARKFEDFLLGAQGQDLMQETGIAVSRGEAP